MNILLMGRRYEGKTTLSLFLSQRIQSRVGAHVVGIFDPRRQFKTIPHTSDLDIFNELMETRGNFAVAFQPTGRANEEGVSPEIAVQFEEFIATLGIDFHLGETHPTRDNLRPFILIVDEAWMLQSRAAMNDQLANLVRLADTQNFYLIQIAHRPTDFSTAARSQADEYFFFRQWLASDLETVREWCGDEVAGEVSQLPLHHLIRYEVSSGKWELWNKPESWYVNTKGESHERTKPSSNSPGEGAEVAPGAGTVRRDDPASNQAA